MVILNANYILQCVKHFLDCGLLPSGKYNCILASIVMRFDSLLAYLFLAP